MLDDLRSLSNVHDTAELMALPVPAKKATTVKMPAAHNKMILDTFIPAIIEAMPDYVLVLNQERRVLAVNSRLLKAFDIADPRVLIGLRPGEALHCIHAGDSPGSCDTGRHCRKCGAVMAIVESELSNTQVAKEYYITLDREEWRSFDLEVLVTPLEIAGMELSLFAMRDISAEKQRTMLEQVFFHDVINTAGGIRGLASALASGSLLTPDEERHYKQWLVTLTEKLVDEIHYQRNLLAAEKGEFKPNLGIVEVGELLREEYALYSNHEVAAERQLLIGKTSECKIISDGAVLRKILRNLIKNALEATPKGGTVTLSSREDDGQLTFLVNNPGVMAEDVQLQLFQRSFSTKAAEGRGTGTYSVKLFGERYLKGKVAFTSSEPDGTTFSFSLPKSS